MSETGKIQRQTIYIKTLAHQSGDLFMAISDQLPGLSIAGFSPEEIEGKLAGAIRDFLEMAGHKVISIDLTRDARVAASNFGPPGFVAHASLESCRAA
ncbi:MAG TPA: hypothetical protein VKV77_06310 [Methylovirgula sp.]|nr:hypothetical protein [Methylovirgula sp.]